MIQLQEILEMSVAERILIVERIWDSINPDDIPLSGAQEQELDARMARYEQGHTKFFSWGEIKNELNKAR